MKLGLNFIGLFILLSGWATTQEKELNEKAYLQLDDTIFTKKTYPKQLTATTIKSRTMHRIPEAFTALGQWVATGNYEINGYVRELFHVITNPDSPEAEKAVFEIQIPVQLKTLESNSS